MIKGLHVAVATSLLGAILTWAQQDTTSKTTPQLDAQAAPQSGGNSVQKSVTADPNYVIGPQDLIDLNVWERAISRTIPVRLDGKILLPPLNASAGGFTQFAKMKAI